MQNEQELFSHVTSAIKTVLNTKSTEISPTTTLIGDLGAESIDFLDISCELEKLISLELDFKEVIRSTGGKSDLSVGEIVSYIQKSAN